MKTFLKKLNQLKLILEIKVDLSRTRVIHQHKVIIIMTTKVQNIWNDPPYSADIKTNIGKTFVNLIKKNTNKLHNIFNKNTLKISYNWLKNLLWIMLGLNQNLLNPSITQYGCNSRNRENSLFNSCVSCQILFIRQMSNAGQTNFKFYLEVALASFTKRFWNYKYTL